MDLAGCVLGAARPTARAGIAAARADDSDGGAVGARSAVAAAAHAERIRAGGTEWSNGDRLRPVVTAGIGRDAAAPGAALRAAVLGVPNLKAERERLVDRNRARCRAEVDLGQVVARRVQARTAVRFRRTDALRTDRRCVAGNRRRRADGHDDDERAQPRRDAAAQSPALHTPPPPWKGITAPSAEAPTPGTVERSQLTNSFRCAVSSSASLHVRRRRNLGERRRRR